jgi:hypothetical protein
LLSIFGGAAAYICARRSMIRKKNRATPIQLSSSDTAKSERGVGRPCEFLTEWWAFLLLLSIVFFADVASVYVLVM